MFFIGAFWDPLLSVWDILKDFFTSILNFLASIFNSIPMFLTLLDMAGTYNNQIMLYCSVLTPFIATFMAAIIIRLVADLL